MKKVGLIGLGMLLSFPSFAQNVVTPPTPNERAEELLLQRERQQHMVDVSSAITLSDEIAKLTKQVEDLKKELEEKNAPPKETK